MAMKPTVLLTFANPPNSREGYLRKLAEETRRLRDLFAPAVQKELCQVEIRTNVTAKDVFDAFQEFRDRIAIFHFGGHAGSYELLLENAAGEAVYADAHGLAGFLGQQKGVQLVFLNGCSTEPQIDLLLKAGVNAVIGTSKAIDDKVASDFAVRFYRGLLMGSDLARSFAEAESATRAEAGGQVRGVMLQQVDGKPLPDEVMDGWPWRLRYRRGAKETARWNLPDAAGDPLHALPLLPKMPLPKAPFHNIRWFERKDAPIFFGRDKEIRDLYFALTPAPEEAGSDANPLILYYGQSGVGKSSLLAAGLLPRLEQKQSVLYLRREESAGLLDTLATALHAAYSLVPGVPDEKAPNKPAASCDLRVMWLAIEAHHAKPLTVILDQVEEGFTRARKEAPDEMVLLFDALASLLIEEGIAADTPRLQGKLLLAFRKDWLADIERLATERSIPMRKELLTRLDLDGVVDAITGPARKKHLADFYDLTIEDGLAERIAADLLADPNSPVAPTLLMLLDRMWGAASERSSGAPRFDTALFNQLSEEGLLLDDFLHTQLDKLKQRHPEAVECGLALDLLAYHTTELGTAKQRTAGEIEAAYQHRRKVMPDLLQACRDLYFLADPRSDAIAAERSTRLAHDTLAPLVRRDFEQSTLPGQRAWRIVRNRSLEWKPDNRAATRSLLDAEDLAVVEKGLEGMRALAPHEQMMLDESRREQKARIAKQKKIDADIAETKRKATKATEDRKRIMLENNANKQLVKERTEHANKMWQRAWWLGVVGAIAFIAALAAIFFGAQTEARGRELAAVNTKLDRLNRDIQADRLTSNGLKVVNEDPSLALLLGVEGIRIHDDYMLSMHDTTSTNYMGAEWAPVSAQENLYSLLDIVGGKPLVGHVDQVVAIALSHDDSRLATASMDGTVRLWPLNENVSIENSIELIEYDRSAAEVAFSPDGRWIATAAEDGSVHLWADGDTGQSSSAIPLLGHAGWVMDVAFSHDSQWLASASTDGSVHLWKLALSGPVGDPFVLDRHAGAVNEIAFSPDNQWLATASDDISVRLWKLDSPDPSQTDIKLAGRNHKLTDIAFSSKSQWIAAASLGPAAFVWPIIEGAPGKVVEIKGHSRYVTDVAFSPAEQWLATGDANGNVRLWDFTLGAPDRSMFELTGHEERIAVVAFDANGLRLATASDDLSIRVWDLAATDPRRDPVILRGHSSTISDIAFSSNGRMLVSASADKTARVWRLVSGDPARSNLRLVGHKGDVNDVAFSPDHRWIATASADEQIRLWNVAIDISDESLSPLNGHNSKITRIAFSPNGSWLASASADAAVRLWKITDDGADMDAVNLEGHTGSVTAIAFAPNDDWLATASQNSIVRLWDMTKADPRQNVIPLEGHKDNVTDVAFSPDGRWLATASFDNTARLWNVASGELNPGSIELPGHTKAVTHVAFSPNSRWLATGSQDTTVRLWEITKDGNDGKSIELARHGGYIRGIAFSPDSRWVATAAQGSTSARLWDLSLGNPKQDVIELEGHGSHVTGVAFSPNGHWLATTSGNTTRLWDLTADTPGQRVIRFTKHSGDITAIAFSPDGQMLATASKDDTVHLWPVEVDMMIALACSRISRHLDSNEWLDYMSNVPLAAVRVEEIGAGKVPKTCFNITLDARDASQELIEAENS